MMLYKERFLFFKLSSLHMF